jgi:outer membrane protein assembly factor BamB
LVEGKPTVWEEVRLWEDCLIGTTGQHLLCMDRRDGEVRWQAKAERDRLSFAAGAGKVFCVDHWLPARARRGEPDVGESSVFALDARSGDELWRTDARTPPDEAAEKVQERFPSLKPHLTYQHTSDVLILTATRSTVAAYKGGTGEVLWDDEIPCRNPPSNWSGPEPPIVLPTVLVTHAGELYDLRTGSRLGERLWTGMNVGYNEGGTRGCGRAIGNEYVVTLRDADAAYFDLSTKSETFLRGVRSGCTNGLIPAGGLLNGPNTAHGCACNWSLFVSFAMVHMPEAEAWWPTPE